MYTCKTHWCSCFHRTSILNSELLKRLKWETIIIMSYYYYYYIIIFALCIGTDDRGTIICMSWILITKPVLWFYVPYTMFTLKHFSFKTLNFCSAQATGVHATSFRAPKMENFGKHYCPGFSLKTLWLHFCLDRQKWRLLETMTQSTSFTSWSGLISHDSTAKDECIAFLTLTVSQFHLVFGPRNKYPCSQFSQSLFLICSIFCN